MKIGILGGAFDPITRGHINVARDATVKYDLDQVWFLPSANHPDGKKMAAFDLRVKMIEDVIRVLNAEKKLVCAQHELANDSGYTIDLVSMLKSRYPTDEFSLIVGSDRADDFHTWHKAEELLDLIDLAPIPRTDNISSSHARALIKSNYFETAYSQLYAITFKEIKRVGLYSK